MLRSYATLTLAALCLAGCSSVEASTPALTHTATPSLPCTVPYGTKVALLSPIPGSTNAEPSAPVVLVASHDLPKTVALVATDAKGRSGPGAPLERTAAPAQAGAAPFPNPVYYRASGVSLRAHHHYTVALDDLAQNGCAPYARISGNARFST